jgi:hypothetical protein
MPHVYRGAVWIFSLALVFGSSLSFGAESDHGDKDHKVARILETRVRPMTLEIRSADAIGWLNYSNKRARISFDAEVAKSMVCRSISTFRLEGGRVVSSDIQTVQFASLCSLAPGEYEYRVDLTAGVGGSPGPGKSFTGKIIVSE